ncbi:hypothetical protein D9758_006208 [Tetrapyrgos nigripes]|uniref:DUF6533 domain-containing protein n=1 Tax=Tetrapyrgos nigripes TaxID=182062 RepID=A0A8H5GB49_9AGAR|nr:hypothetical protein D9758_006208 [Tetrapyrgos nigripes]
MASTIVQTFNNTNASRYVSLAGLVVLVYDHCITFDDEVEFIWKAKWKLPKVLFLLLRYIVPIALLVNIIYMSGISGYVSDKHCVVWFGVSEFGVLVLLHLWNISDRNKFLVIATLVIYILAFIANMVTAALAVSYLPGHTTYSPIFKLCALDHKKGIPFVWAPGLVLDVLIIPTLIYNALERPRDARTELTTQVFRDGLLFFAILLILRLTNLLLAIFAPVSIIPARNTDQILTRLCIAPVDISPVPRRILHMGMHYIDNQ